MQANISAFLLCNRSGKGVFRELFFECATYKMPQITLRILLSALITKFFNVKYVFPMYSIGTIGLLMERKDRRNVMLDNIRM